MKYLYLLSCLALAACNSSNSGMTTYPANTNAGAGFKRWIPEWKGGDTLIAAATNGPNQQWYQDTIYTEKELDTTYIRYRGVRYYLFQYYNNANVNEDTSGRPQGYTWVAINTRPDTVNRPIKAGLSAFPNAYRTPSGSYNQKQSLSGCVEPFFPKTSTSIYTGWKTR